MGFSDFFNYPSDPPSGAPADFDRAFWREQPQSDWKKLLQFSQSLRFRKGEKAVTVGQRDTGFYIISFGNFQQEHSKGGRPTPVQEGECFGLGPFFDGHPHLLSLTAQTDGELIYVTRTVIETIAAREPLLARDILFECGRLLALEMRMAANR